MKKKNYIFRYYSTRDLVKLRTAFNEISTLIVENKKKHLC